MLGNMYVINAWFFFSAVWAIAKSFIDEKTAKKVSLLGSDYMDELKKHIDMENFPKCLWWKCECKDVKGGCMYSDIWPWNPEGGLTQVFNSEVFDRVK